MSKDQGLPVELEILELFGRANMVTLGPTDVERLTGVSKGTVSSRMKALAAAGYLKEAGPGRYQPGPKMLETAMNYLGLVMRQIDQARQLLDVNLAEVRSAIGVLAQAMPGTGTKGKGDA